MHREIAVRCVVVTSVVLCWTACSRPGTETGPPNFLLISIDALRADHLSCYGYDRHTSPVLDRLASRGTRFSRAFANTHGTPPSHATLFSSLYQETHRVGVGTGQVTPADNTMPAEIEMVQEILGGAGWSTVAVTGGGYMAARFGFNRGFDDYVDAPRRVDRAAGILFEHLRDAVARRRPVFAFLHTYQVHSPYDPPRRFRSLFGEFQGSIEATSEALLEINSSATREFSREDFEYLESLYDGEIRFTDEVLGRLLDSLEGIGFLDQTIVIVTSDHGEEFGEHGGVLHGGKLFEELLHVPLIISGNGIDSGVVDPSLVSLVDIAPTVLALAGLEVPRTMEGRNVFDRSPSPGKWRDQRVFAQYSDGLYCVRTPRWKLLQRAANQRVKLFDLRRDPGEQSNLGERYPDVAKRLVSELEEWRSRRPRLELGPRQGLELSDEMADELRALGYVE